MSDSIVNYLSMEGDPDEGSQGVKNLAVVGRLDPGQKGWFQLIATFDLPATTIFSMGIAVAPGSDWSKEFECYSVELVQPLPHTQYPERVPPNCSRTRVFHHDEPVSLSGLEPSPFIPLRPCVERVKIENLIYIDVRGVQSVESTRWSEKILALLKGAWLITRDNNLLTEGDLRYEIHISSTIEAMAKKGQDKTTAPRFTVTNFAAHWPLRKSRSNMYKIIPEHRWEEIMLRYYRRWRELHGE